MPEEHCFVCASNEGIFLDIFIDGRNYRDTIEICLSLKIQKKKMVSTKICHKCVYELDQCSKFVQRYKKTHRIEKGKLYKKRGHCCLCMESGKKGYIFDLWDESRLDNSIGKLNQLFEIDFDTEDFGSLSICLDCRYNLDVLFDMRSLFKDTSAFLEDIMNGDVELSELPKISTNVVKRKTTSARKCKLAQLKPSLEESDSSKTASDLPRRLRASSARKSSPHERKCDKCDTKIDDGMDMYRYHHTGSTVCKECWLTMDPCGEAKSKARKVNNKAMKTKLCSVFLKDILTNTLDSEKSIPDCKVERGSDGEIIYIISSDETDNESEKKVLPLRSTRSKRKDPAIDTKPKKKLKTRKAKLTRSNSVQSLSQIDKRNTRQTRSESAEISDIDSQSLRKRSETIEKSVASTSKSTRAKKSKELRTRVSRTKKRKIDKSESSSSSYETILPSKVRRFLSPSYDIDSNNSKNESDSDNRPYVCKICSNDFENKVEGMTHELTHSKKLGVMLEKVSMPEQSDEENIFESDPSTEYNSPPRSNGEPPSTANNLPSSITDGSEVKKLPEISATLSDDNSQNQSSRVKDTQKSDEDIDEEEQKKKGETDNVDINKKETETIENDVEKREDEEKEKNEEEDHEILSKDRDGNENGMEKGDEEKNVTEKSQNKVRETDDKHLPSESIQDDESVHEKNGKEMDEVNEQPILTNKQNHHGKDYESNEGKLSKNTEVTQNKISDEEENEIVKAKQNCLESPRKSKDVETTLEHDAKVNEKTNDDAGSPGEVVKKNNETLTDECNIKKKDEVNDNENSTCEGRRIDGDEGVDEIQKKNGISENECKENSPNEEIPNGNMKNSSDVDSVVSDDDKVDHSGKIDCIKMTNRSEDHLDSNTANTDKKKDYIAKQELNDATHPEKVESRVACTENDGNDDEDIGNKSNEIENRLAEMMGEDEPKSSEACDKKTSEEIKNMKEMPSSDSITIKNINCES